MVILFLGCANKAIISDDNALVDEETIRPNMVEAPEETPEPKKMLEDGSIIGSVLFDFDKFDIRADMQAVLESSVSLIEENPDMKVLIEGNTDEFGSDEYNFALGNRRALAVKTALITRGIDKADIDVVSLGKTKPVCVEKTVECYQKNRRGDIRLLKR